MAVVWRRVTLAQSQLLLQYKWKVGHSGQYFKEMVLVKFEKKSIDKFQFNVVKSITITSKVSYFGNEINI